jgi:hypothetical protein
VCRAEPPNADRRICPLAVSPVTGAPYKVKEPLLLLGYRDATSESDEQACEVIMLRVTVEERGEQVIFRVEGKLIEPWAIELERCWRSTHQARSCEILQCGSG